jgi:hypothetical protein
MNAKLPPGRYSCEKCGYEWTRQVAAFAGWVWCLRPGCQSVNVVRVGDLTPEPGPEPIPTPPSEPPAPVVDGSANLAGARARAVAFLRETLADGAMRATEVRRLARERGFSRRTTDRSRLTAGVKSVRVGGVGPDGWWEWFLRTPRNEEV